MKTTLPTADQLRLDWSNNPRWAGITRPYSAETSQVPCGLRLE